VGTDDFVLAPIVGPEFYGRIRQLDWRMSSFRAGNRIKMGDLVIDAVGVEGHVPRARAQTASPGVSTADVSALTVF
jgi:DNA-binding response OmpR family regulator